MNSKWILLVTAALSAVASSHCFLEANSNLSLLSFMAQSNDLMQRDAARSLDCFNYYLPLIQNINQKYKEDFEACELTYNKTRLQAETATLESRNYLTYRAQNACEIFTNCPHFKSAENVFQCFAEAGSKNSKEMYSIYKDASSYLSDLQDELRLIKSKENKCTNKARHEYELKTAETYDDLNNCISATSEEKASTDHDQLPEDILEAESSGALVPTHGKNVSLQGMSNLLKHKMGF